MCEEPVPTHELDLAEATSPGLLVGLGRITFSLYAAGWYAVATVRMEGVLVGEGLLAGTAGVDCRGLGREDCMEVRFVVLGLA